MDQNKLVRSRSPTSAAKRFSSTMSAEHHSRGSSSPPSLKLQSNLSASYHPSKSSWSQSDYPITGGSLHVGSSPSSLPLDQFSSSGGARPKTQASEATQRGLSIEEKPSVKEVSEGNSRKRSTLAFEILVEVQFTLSASVSNIQQKHTKRIPVDYVWYMRWQLITTCPLLREEAMEILESHNIGMTFWGDRVILTIRDNALLQTNKVTQIILDVVDKLDKDTAVLQPIELPEGQIVYLTNELCKSSSFKSMTLYLEVIDNTVYIACYGKEAKHEVSDIVSHFKNTRPLDRPQTVSTCFNLPAYMKKTLLYFKVFEKCQSQCQDVIWSVVNHSAQFIITLTGSKESVEEARSLISHNIGILNKFEQRIHFNTNVLPAFHILFLEDVIQNHLDSKGFTCAVVQHDGKIYVYSDCGQEIQAATEAAKAICCKSIILTGCWRERFDDLKQSVKAHVKGPYVLQSEAGAKMNIIGSLPVVEEAEKVLKCILASEKTCKQSTQEGLASSTPTQQNEKSSSFIQQNEKNTVSICYPLSVYMENVLCYFNVLEKCKSQCQVVISTTVNHNAQIIIKMTGSKQSVDKACSFISSYKDILIKSEKRIHFNTNVLPAIHILFLEDVIQYHLDSKGFTCAVVQHDGKIYVYSDCGQEIKAATEAAKAICCKPVILTGSWREKFDDLKQRVEAHVKGPYVLQSEAGAKMNIIGYVPAVEEAEKVLKSILVYERSCKQSTQEGLASSTLTQQNEKNQSFITQQKKLYLKHCESDKSKAETKSPETAKVHSYALMSCPGDDRVWSFPEDRVLCLTLNAKENSAKVVVRLSMQMSDEAPFKCSKKSADGIRVELKLPRWKGGSNNETEEFRRMIEKTLAKTAEEKADSVMLMVDEMFGWNKNWFLQRLIGPLVQHLRGKTQPKKIILCVSGEDIFVEAVEEIQDLVGKPCTGEASASCEHLKVQVIEGSLHEIKADVLVNTTAANLDLKHGQVSSAILRAAGMEVQDECWNKFPNGLRLGEMAITKGYKLKCQKVFHGALPKFNPEKELESIQNLRTLVETCLCKANEYRFESIAFPAIGAGNLKYPVAYVASEMFGAVERFKMDHTQLSLRDVFFVIHPKDTSSLVHFKKIEKEMAKPIGSPHMSAVSDTAKQAATRSRVLKDVKPAQEQSTRSGSSDDVKPTKEQSTRSGSSDDVKPTKEQSTRSGSSDDVKPTKEQSTRSGSSDDVKPTKEQSTRSGSSVDVKQTKEQSTRTGSSDDVKPTTEQSTRSGSSDDVKSTKEQSTRSGSSDDVKPTKEQSTRSGSSDDVKPTTEQSTRSGSSDDVKPTTEQSTRSGSSDDVKPTTEQSARQVYGLGEGKKEFTNIFKQDYAALDHFFGKEIRLCTIEAGIKMSFSGNVIRIEGEKGALQHACTTIDRCLKDISAMGRECKPLKHTLCDVTQTVKQHNKKYPKVFCFLDQYNKVLTFMSKNNDDLKKVSQTVLKQITDAVNDASSEANMEKPSNKDGTTKKASSQEGVSPILKSQTRTSEKTNVENKGEALVKNPQDVKKAGTDKGAFGSERTIPTGVNDPRAGVAGCPTEKPVRTEIQTAKQEIERNSMKDEMSDQIAGKKNMFASSPVKVIPSFIEDRDCLKCIFTKGFVVKIFTASILELSHMDTIVCSEDQSGKAAGMIAKALLKQGGVEYQREKAAAFKVSPPPGEIVTTGGGKSNFKAVIHALVPLRRDDTNIKSLYLKIFQEAIVANSNTLAMSLLATGAGGQEAMIASKILYNSCMEFGQNNPDGRLNVSVVNIDDFKTKDIVGVFKEFINQHSIDLPPMTSPSSWKQTGQPSSDPVTPPTTQKTKESELVDRELTSLRSHAGESSDDTDVAEVCVICMDEMDNAKPLRCGHRFCTECIDQYFKVKQMCPTCGEVCGVILGDQPDGVLQVWKSTTPLAGHPGCGCIILCYIFPDGKQQAHHPSPGMAYKGFRRVAYLPDNDEGRKVAAMLIEAFQRRLVFTIGHSRTTGKDGVITWNDIHHKTDPRPNTQFGYPDASYLLRVKEELAAKGVTEKDLKQPFLAELSNPTFKKDWNVTDPKTTSV